MLNSCTSLCVNTYALANFIFHTEQNSLNIYLKILHHRTGYIKNFKIIKKIIIKEIKKKFR